MTDKPRSSVPGIEENHTNSHDLTVHPTKFQRQLDTSQEDVARFAWFLSCARIEVKSETGQWERTSNICIEEMQNGKPSGISVTKAEIWAHELCREIDGRRQTLCYILFPIERLRELVKIAHAEKREYHNGGDGGRFSGVLIPLSRAWIFMK